MSRDSYSQPCPTCGAGVDEPCTVRYSKRRRAHYTHADRKRAIAIAARSATESTSR